MKSRSNPTPQAPDPQAVADAQMRLNYQTARMNQDMRPNQRTPWGNLTYTQGAPNAAGVPQYSADVTLPPDVQAALEAQQSSGRTRAELLNQLLHSQGGTLTQPLNMSNLHPVYDRYAANQEWNPQYGSSQGAPQGMGQGMAQGMPQGGGQRMPQGMPQAMGQMGQAMGQMAPSAGGMPMGGMDKPLFPPQGGGVAGGVSGGGIPFEQIMPGGGAPPPDPAAIAAMVQRAQGQLGEGPDAPSALMPRRQSNNPIAMKTLANLLRGGA